MHCVIRYYTSLKKFNFIDQLNVEIYENLHLTNVVGTTVWYSHREAASVAPTTTLLSSIRLLVVPTTGVNMLDVTINVIT